MDKTNDVIGIGNALMDFLVEVDEQRFLEFNLKKGEMHLVEEEQAKKLLDKLSKAEIKIERIPGGSAANTLKGIALLGGNVTLYGTLGKDEHGEYYVEEIKKNGLNGKFKRHEKQTGHALTFITPDSERTFSVHLGAAIHIEKEDIIEEDIANSKILHLEAYQLEGNTKEVVMHAIEIAKKNNTLVSIDLADPGLIRRNKEFLLDLLTDKIDIVFVNENEAQEITGEQEEKALQKLSETISTVIVKLGKKGSLIQHQGMMSMVDAVVVKAIDTTGAGDSYAAGFLYGLCKNWEIEKAGKLGSLLAAKVVAQQGVSMKDIDAEELKNLANANP